MRLCSGIFIYWEMLVILFNLLFVSLAGGQVIQEDTDYLQIKCLVCEQVLKQVQNAILKVNPQIKVDVGGYRLDTNPNRKVVEYRKSEGFLTELMENICDKMDNYVKAKHRVTGEIIVMSLLSEDGQMNALMSEVDVIQDDSLNKNLKMYCEDIIENYDEVIVDHLQKSTGIDTLATAVCELVCADHVKKDKDEL